LAANVPAVMPSALTVQPVLAHGEISGRVIAESGGEAAENIAAGTAGQRLVVPILSLAFHAVVLRPLPPSPARKLHHGP
jgi:hypothetical protein